MSEYYDSLAERITARCGARVTRVPSATGELTFELAASDLIAVATILRDEPEFHFEQLIDLCGLDLLGHGQGDWATERTTRTGFSRAREEAEPGHLERRFVVVTHLMSVRHNHRLRLRTFCAPGEPPMMPSLVDLWPSANWAERECFDLFGILFDGHPDLRRILTDYGFIGHPFRKDFPLSGHVEVRYDPEKGRVVYQPVSIEPRNNVPRVVRDDGRYGDA
jgi:NADH-quinone oxidoreductase subunit C